MRVTINRQAVLEKTRKAAAKLVASIAVDLQGRIQAKLNQHNSSLSSGGNASQVGSPPGNRTGALMRSIQAVNTSEGPNHPKWTVGTKMVYAKIQEFGGRIRAKKGKYLAIPVGVEGQRAARAAKGNIRSLDLKVVRMDGKAYLVKWKGSTKRGGAGGVKVLFVLKKEVYLPARPYFRPTIAEYKSHMKERIGELKIREPQQ